MIGTLAVALLNASSDGVARKFAYFYGAVSLAVLVRVLFPPSSLLTLFARAMDTFFTNTELPSSAAEILAPSVHLTLRLFERYSHRVPDALTGPLILSGLLFFGILANFVIRGALIHTPQSILNLIILQSVNCTRLGFNLLTLL